MGAEHYVSEWSLHQEVDETESEAAGKGSDTKRNCGPNAQHFHVAAVEGDANVLKNLSSASKTIGSGNY